MGDVVPMSIYVLPGQQRDTGHPENMITKQKVLLLVSSIYQAKYKLYGVSESTCSQYQ
jgi:hypothetical protein